MSIVLSGDTGITTPMYNGSITANAVTPSVNMKNRIINGAMVIDQRNAGASVTPTDGQYTLDRWQGWASAVGKYTVQQNAGSVTPPDGFKNYLGVTSTSAYSVNSGDYISLRQVIEGYNIADLGWGTANAKTVTLSFWVRSSLTGTFGGVLKNYDNTRSYPFTYTISSANTWEQKSITVVGETTGTWLSTNGNGISLIFGLGVGSTFLGTAGSWASANYWSATGATSVVGTNGATFYITGVQLEVGSTATSFDYRPYGTELALCQRYFEKSYDTEVAVGTATGNGSAYQNSLGLSGTVSTGQIYVSYRTTKRTQPTITMYSPNNGASGVVYQYSTGNVAAASQQQGQNSFVGYSTGLGLSGNTNFGFQWTASAEL
jgi:hypothetical protein